jgi:HAD superfamily hydrolase (TIGR01509 family)
VLEPPELVIFDCDGVLIDSEIIGCRIEAEELTRAGIPITADEIMSRFTGVTAGESFRSLEAEHGRVLPADFEQRVTAVVLAVFERELQPIAGIESVLDRIELPVCVASSSGLDRLRHTLGLTGLWRHFAPNVFSAEQVGGRGKPAPDLFLHAAKRMGVAPEHSVVVEDSTRGVQAGLAAGMRVLGFTGAGHCPPDHGDALRRAGAHAVFARMEELPALLASWSGGAARAALDPAARSDAPYPRCRRGRADRR